MEEKKLSDCLEGYLEFDNLCVGVRWDKIQKLTTANRRKRTEIMNALIQMRILTFQDKGNYGLIGAGVEVNPCQLDGLPGRVYFRREEDARLYKESAFKDAGYSVNLVKYLD